jgi:hypothetical protein
MNIFISTSTTPHRHHLAAGMAGASCQYIDDFDDDNRDSGLPDNQTAPPIPHHEIQTFATLHALELSMRAHKEAHGYGIVKQAVEKKDGSAMVRYINCGKGGTPKLKDNPKKKTGSKLTTCPFRMVSRAVDFENPAGE